MSFIEDLNKQINQTIEEVNKTADKELPKAAVKLVAKVFSPQGDNNGRNWKPNAPSTIKRKKLSYPNIETGQLVYTLLEEGYILDDNYMDKLPTPTRSGNPDGYAYANEMREFDNIGRTPQDEEFLEQQIEKVLNDKYSK